MHPWFQFNMPNVRKPKTRYVPYVKGFRPPTGHQKVQAVSNFGEAPGSIPPQFLCKESHFDAIPKCTARCDWLAQYKEQGQSYKQFLMECPWLSQRKRKYIKNDFNPDGENLPEKYPGGTVYILPLGDFSGSEKHKHMATPDSDSIIEYSEKFLGLPVKKLPKVQLEAQGGHMTWIEEKDAGRKGTRIVGTNIKSRYHDKTGRYQLCITDVLLKLRKHLPDDAICLLALTMYDLYEDETDLFVAGMAAGNHRVAVFSLLRYDPNLSFSKELWYRIRHSNDYSESDRQNLILQRSCKLVVHEICHLLGIDHCIFYSCCMNGSGHLEEDYQQPMYLCPVDLRKLHTLCGFDITLRYKKLRDFYQKHGMDVECHWVENRLAFLKQQSDLAS